MYSIRFHLIHYLYEIMELLFCEIDGFYVIVGFVGCCSNMIQGFFNFIKSHYYAKHQELASTSKDPPRRVDMKEMSLIFWGKNIS